jgi:cell division protein FtsQ
MRQQLLTRQTSHKNRRTRRKAKRWVHILNRIFLGFKVIAAMVFLVAVTAMFILVHNLITHCDYFRAKELEIEGLQRLTRQQVVRQAKVREGDNILSVKLSRVRRRLLTHPWIAEADVSREIPSRLIIRIKEHFAIAAVNLGGKRFLLNQRGQIFKKWNPDEGLHIPVIKGLRLSDLAVYDNSRPNHLHQALLDSIPYRAVMQILDLGQRPGSVLPNHLIRQIRVDRQIGITVHAFDRDKAISFGYSDYIGKYQMLAQLLAYLEPQRNKLDFDRIDLNNLQRIVINPVRWDGSSQPSGNG